MPTGHPNPKPKPAKKRRNISPERRAKLQDQARNLKPPSRWSRQDSIDRIEAWCSERGVDPDVMVSECERISRDEDVSLSTAVHRFLTGSEKPAETSRGPEPDNESANAVTSDVTSLTTAEDLDPDSMVSSLADESDPFDDDPRLHASFTQTTRELRHEASDDELQASRAFLSHVEPRSSYPTPHETTELLDAIRRAYRELAAE
jgi:hypothetical protein